jgi:hypothetical protein
MSGEVPRTVGVPMSPRLIIGIVSFCVAMTGVFMANLFLYIMIGEINRKRRDGDLVSYFGFTLPKTLRIHDEYHRLYPGGRLHIYSWVAFALAMLGLASVALCSGVV